MTEMDRLRELAARLEVDPAALGEVRDAGDALADASGDAGAAADAALRWRLAVLRAVIAAPPDGDAVRELYGELVDRYRGDPARLAKLRAVGEDIRRLEAEGRLASSMVVRSRRSPRSR